MNFPEIERDGVFVKSQGNRTLADAIYTPLHWAPLYDNDLLEPMTTYMREPWTRVVGASSGASAATLDTLKERQGSYGKFIDSASVAQRIKRALDSPGFSQMAPDQREALHLIATKIGRLITGDANHVDSWHDIAGYAQLVEKRLQGVLL